MRAIKRIVELLASAAKHEQYAGSVAPGSIVAVAQLKVQIVQDVTVERVTADEIALSDGAIYTPQGWYDSSYSQARFIVEPYELSREQIVKRSLRKELENFAWKDLTVEGLDAVLKYASLKRVRSPVTKYPDQK